MIYTENEEKEREQRNKAAKYVGLVNAFNKRSIAISDEYLCRIAKAHQSIDIMGFGLSALLDDFGDHFEEWAKHANVRIILLDPDFPNQNLSFAAQRDKEERSNIGQIRSDVCDFLTKTARLWQDKNINFNVRLAQALPSINMFRIDNEIFWGPYLINSKKSVERLLSRNLPTFIVDDSGCLFDFFNSHFDAIWNDWSVEPRVDLLNQGKLDMKEENLCNIQK